MASTRLFKFISYLMITLFFCVKTLRILGQQGYCFPNTYGMSMDPSYECKVSYDYKIPPSKMLADYYRNYGKIEKQLSISKEALANFGSGVDFATELVGAASKHPAWGAIFFISGIGLKKIYSTLSEPLHREFENQLKKLGTYVINLKGQKDPLLFSTLMNQMNQNNLNELLKNQLAEAVYEDPEIRGLFGDDFQKLNKEQQITTITTVLKVVLDTDSQTRLDLEKSKGSIRELKENVSESYKNIQDLAQKIKTVENIIPDQIQSMAYHLHAYEKMTPEQKMAAVDEGKLFPNLSEEQKTTLKNASQKEQEAQIKAHTMESLKNAYYITVGGLDSLARIAQSLGADPGLVNAVGHMTRLAQSGIAIAMAASGQPNPQAIMMAVTSVVGFFTGFLTDDDRRAELEAKRFKAIMDEFLELKKGIKLLYENDLIILKNQGVMIENQQAILKTVFDMHKDLSNKVHTLHVDLASQLSDLKDKVDANTAAVIQGLSEGMSKCMAFLNIDQLGAMPLFYKIRNYEELKDYFSTIDQKDDFRLCKKALSYSSEYKFSENQALHPIFYTKYYENKDFPGVGEKRKNYEALFNYCNNHPQRKEASPLSSFLSSPLNYNIIRRHILLLLEILPFEQVLDENGNLESQDRIASKEFQFDTALYRHLEGAKQLIEFALLQHELLAGRSCMDALYSDFQSSHPETRINLYNILDKNPILGTNLFTESLHKTMGKNGQNFLFYDVLLDRKESIPVLKDDFNQDWYFRFKKNCEDKDENPFKCMRAMYRASHIKLDAKEKARRVKLVLDKYAVPSVDSPVYEEKLYCHKYQNSPPYLLLGEKDFKMDVKTEDGEASFPKDHLKFSEVEDYSECKRVDYVSDGKCHNRDLTYGQGCHSYGLNVVYEKLEIVGYRKIPPSYPSKKIVIEGQKCKRLDRLVDVRYITSYPYSNTGYFDLFFDYWTCRDIVKVEDYPKRGFELESGYPYPVGDPRELDVNIANSDILRGKSSVYGEEREKLLALRSLVVAKQAEYEVLKSSSQEERDAWFEMMRKKALSEEQK